MTTDQQLFQPPPSRGHHHNHRDYVIVAVERGIDHPRPSPTTHTSANTPGNTAEGLTYATTEPCNIGDRVEVPLGRGNTTVAGIVVRTGGPELAQGFPLDRIKPITKRTGAALPEHLVNLARWISQYYVCPFGMALATLMPAAVKQAVGKRTKTILEPNPDFDPDNTDSLPPTARDALQSIQHHFNNRQANASPLSARELADVIGARTLAPINRLIRAGALIEKQIPVITAGRAEHALKESTAAEPPDTPPQLTEEQTAVITGIQSLGLHTFNVHLVRGVTGSGKTEIYLRILENILDSGKSALVLVPEIALTPQTAGRFLRRFGPNTRFNNGAGAGVAVLHSGLTAAQRNREWSRAAAGDARVVIGARSAIFAPMPDLGVIVVDEEHDSSYKQDQLPRYHARDVAVKRAHDLNIPVLLGSATPSLESWANTKPPNPRYKLWQLTKRVGSARLPAVQVVDLAEEERLRARLAKPIRNHTAPPTPRADPRRPQHFRQIGPTLENAVANVLASPSAQAILLLNRRGYASYIACTNTHCNAILQCEHCDAAMVHHRRQSLKPGGFIRCHHCLAEQKLPQACPLCNSRIVLMGAGTQRVEEELAQLFPDQLGLDPATGAPTNPDSPPALLRVDSDTMHSAREYFTALDHFAKGHARILLGTQMIAKGLDFPNVRLVGVINADTAAAMPDFRSAERTFQLVSQVAGRAGRANDPGVVIVQTVCADSPAIQFAQQHDYIGFADSELADRHAAGLPPASRMARIVCRDRDYNAVRNHAQQVHDQLAASAALLRLPVAVSLPHECVLARVADHHRFAIDLTSNARSAIQSVLAHTRAQGGLVSDAHTAIDIDPISML